MKICIIRPSFVTMGGTVGVEIILPLGLAYLAGFLRQQGHEVHIVDVVGESINAMNPIDDIPGGMTRGLPDELAVARIPDDVDVIGVSCMFSVNWVVNRRTIQAIRQRFPDVPLIIGGEHATAMPEYCLRDSQVVDFVVLGEGENTTAEFLHALDKGEDPTTVPGLGFLRDGVYTVSPPRARERQIDLFPTPAWDLLPVETYVMAGVSAGLDCGRAMPIIASRGCPYNCTFCTNTNMWKRLWRVRSVKKVVDEIEDNVRRFRIDHVDFYDLTLITKRSWIVDFCQEMIERDLGVSWQIFCTRSEALDAEVTRLLKKAGCDFVYYAPESGSETVLTAIRKKMDVETMLTSVSASVDAGLRVKLNYIVGFPDDRLVDILASFRMAMRAAWRGAYDASFFTYCPYPGSELFDRLVGEGRITVNDAYFFKLATFNFSRTTSQAYRFSDSQVRWLCLVGTALFYLVSFARRPHRVLGLIRDLMRGTGRTKLSAALVRLRKARRNLKQAAIRQNPVA